MLAKCCSLTRNEEGYLELRESKIMERKKLPHICASEVVEERKDAQRIQVTRKDLKKGNN